MDIDVSAGLKMKLDEAQQRAKKFYEAGDSERAAEEYRRCARIMKELVKSAVGAETQKARLEKARQYLELARQIEDGRAVAVTPDERKAHAERRRDAAARKAAGRPADGETETDEDALTAQVAELIVKSPITWDDIGGLSETKREIQAAYALAMATPPQGVKIKSNRNLLFYGPPGTGKTLLAAATSNGLEAAFFNVKVSSLLSKYFGESAKLVTALFGEARRRAPSVVFFDEIESLVPSRSGNMDGPEKRILSTFLSELDGLAGKGAKEFLLTIAATNTPWQLDEAILSRFGKLVYVPLPDDETRARILDLQLDDAGYTYELSGADLVERSAGYSGRDIEKVCTEAIERMLAEANRTVVEAAGRGARALRQQQLVVRPISRADFDAAFRKIRAKTTAQMLRRFDDWAKEAEG